MKLDGLFRKCSFSSLVGTCDLETKDFIEYNNKPFRNSKLLEVREVKYSNFPFIESIYNKDSNKFLTLKSRWWEYEKEYRIISNNYGSYKFNEECIKAIFIGARCDLAHEIVLCNLAFIKNIKIYKGKFFKNSFDLYFEPINLDSVNKRFDSNKFIEEFMKLKKIKE